MKTAEELVEKSISDMVELLNTIHDNLADIEAVVDTVYNDINDIESEDEGMKSDCEEKLKEIKTWLDKILLTHFCDVEENSEILKQLRKALEMMKGEKA